MQWGGIHSKQKLDSAVDVFLDNCKGLWDSRSLLHRDTAEVYWEEVVEDDFACDLEGDETQATVVRCPHTRVCYVCSCQRVGAVAAGKSAGAHV